MEISKEQLAALLQQAFVAGFQYSEGGINGEVCSGREREKMLAEATEYAAKDIAQAAWGKSAMSETTTKDGIKVEPDQI